MLAWERMCSDWVHWDRQEEWRSPKLDEARRGRCGNGSGVAGNLGEEEGWYRPEESLPPEVCEREKTS